MGEAFGRNQAYFVLPSAASFTQNNGSKIVSGIQTGLNWYPHTDLQRLNKQYHTSKSAVVLNKKENFAVLILSNLHCRQTMDSCFVYFCLANKYTLNIILQSMNLIWFQCFNIWSEMQNVFCFHSNQTVFYMKSSQNVFHIRLKIDPRCLSGLMGF